MRSSRPKAKKTSVLVSSTPLRVLNASFAAAEPLTETMSDPTKSLHPESSVTDEAFEKRKAFCRFDETDAALLTELRDLFERHADAVVDRFYDHLTQHEALQPLLSDEATVKRLKGFQRDYLLSLASGDYGVEYARNRLKIGRTHDRIGLESEWYLGTYGLYLDVLLPLIQEHYRSDGPRAARTSAALSKLMVLDMQLVLDAYFGMRQRRAVERSEQLAAVGELAASIAHEVRNPLAGMKGALQVLRKELAVKPSNLEIVDELLAQIVRLEHLVRDLLTYARPRALERQLFDLHELLDRLLRLYKDECEARGVTVERIYGPGTSRLTADPRQIEQVLLNLLHNALQAMTDGGTLTVITRAADGSTVITLKDSGKGIPAADLPKILQPFFTTKHRGSGLGLPIVKKIAEAHGGTIQVASELGAGTTATVKIPNQTSA